MDLLQRFALRGALIGLALGVPVHFAAEAVAAPAVSVRAGANTSELYVYVDSFYAKGRFVTWDVLITRAHGPRAGRMVSRGYGSRATNNLRFDHIYYGKPARTAVVYRVAVRVTWRDLRGKIEDVRVVRNVRARVR